jgi:hypothetical protein
MDVVFSRMVWYPAGWPGHDALPSISQDDRSAAKVDRARWDCGAVSLTEMNRLFLMVTTRATVPGHPSCGCAR